MANKCPYVESGQIIVMPNHFHGIVRITDIEADLRVCPSQKTCDIEGIDAGGHMSAPLARILRWFKTMTTDDYILGVKTMGWPRFEGRLWQRNYYEHVVRDEPKLDALRHYIIYNPSK